MAHAPEITDLDIASAVQHIRRSVWIIKAKYHLTSMNLADYLLWCETRERAV